MSASLDEASTAGLPQPLEAIARRPRLAALLGAMCIAFSGIFYRYAGVSPSTGVVFRCLFGLPILLGVALLERRRFGPLPRACRGSAVRPRLDPRSPGAAERRPTCSRAATNLQRGVSRANLQAAQRPNPQDSAES